MHSVQEMIKSRQQEKSTALHSTVKPLLPTPRIPREPFLHGPLAGGSGHQSTADCCNVKAPAEYHQSSTPTWNQELGTCSHLRPCALLHNNLHIILEWGTGVNRGV